MKVGIKSGRTALLQVWTRLRGNSAARPYTADEPPLRAALFSSNQMEQHGRALAGGHTLTQGRARDRLLPRLSENEGVLIDVCNLLTAAVTANRRIAPAGEWLLDNFYLIEEQIRTARRHFPPGYSRELPRLLRGASAGLPRVYDIALETISHGDGRVDLESLSSFLIAYQTVTVLTLGELWAIPIMLRLALIENLRMGVATPREIAAFWHLLSLSEASAWCVTQARAGHVVAVQMEGERGTAYALPTWESAARRTADAPARMRLLSPFDPILRDRRRASRLFGFDYRFEAFVPAAKRAHGYYVMPILERDRLVGRVEPKLDRERSALDVRGVWWEPGVRPTRARRAMLEDAVARLAGLVGAADVRVSRTS